MEKSRKIRVALCIVELFIGGAEKALVELALHLDRNRFDPVVYVLRPRKFHSGKASFIPTLESHGIPIHFLDISGPLSFLRGIGRLKKGLTAQKAEILQTFMFHANFLGRFARRANRPFVFSGIRVSEKERRYHLLLDRWTSRRVDAYVCVSRSVADFSVKEGKIPVEKIVVIPNAVSENRMKTGGPIPMTSTPNHGAASPLSPSFADPHADAFFSTKGQKIVFVGRLTRQKGLDWLLSTAKFWLDGPGSENRSFWLIGDGPLEGALRSTVKSLPTWIADHIHFAGWRPDIPAILAASDLLILPSRYEGMPNVLLEASAAALPVLSSRCDGVEEILGENAPDQTFEFGNDEEFIKKLRRLLESGSLRQELGNANRRRVLAEFSVEKMVERYEKLWEDYWGRTQNRF